MSDEDEMNEIDDSMYNEKNYVETEKMELVGRFDNVLRLRGNNVELDIYNFDESIEPFFLHYSFRRMRDPTYSIMNGTVYEIGGPWTYISFGGLLGKFSMIKDKKINDPVTLWYKVSNLRDDD